MQPYVILSHVEQGALLSPAVSAPVGPFSPHTGDVNLGIIAAVICIALFLMFVTLRQNQKRRK